MTHHNMKPFRLIAQTELNFLQQRFDERIERWNEHYAIHPLSCKLDKNVTLHDDTDTLWLITDANAPIALCEKKDLHLIQQSALNKQSPSFHAISENLLLSLLNQLFDTESLQWQTTTHRDEYGYTGSPSLRLTLKCDPFSTTLYLHPQWVLNTLPKAVTTSKPICSVDKALSTHSLALSVELSPITLSLFNLIQLRVGDVIKTDHPMTKPLLLKNGETTISTVDIGEQSIQISRTT